MKYNFKQDAKFYFSLYDKYRADNNLDKAAEYLLEAIKISRSLDLRVELASLYSEMGQLDMSNEECYYVLSKDHKNSEIINILSANFTEKRNYRAAYYYFSKMDYYGIEDMPDLIPDTLNRDLNKFGFRLAWSNGVKDCSDIKEEAEIHLAMKNYKDAIRALERIYPNSPQYIWARKMLVFGYYMIEDYERALEIANDLLEKAENDISMMTVVYNILTETKQFDKAEKIIERIKKAECADVGDVLKAGYCLMSSKKYDDALALIKREYSNYPYNDNLMLLMSSAYCLSGNPQKAKDILLRLINMYGDRTFAKFYLESINRGEFNETGFTYDIPALRAISLNVEIEKNLKSLDKFGKAFIYDARFKSIVRWRILTRSDDDMAFMLINTVGSLNNSASAKFLQELLLKENISGEAKAVIMSYLINAGNRKRIAAVYESYFRIFNMINAKETTPSFVYAYSLSCIYLSPMLKDYEDDVYTSFIKLNMILNSERTRMKSPEAIAALILYNCDNLEISKEANILAGLFGANAGTLRKYIKILESKYDNLR